jgi:arabinofuranosyltransferase
LGPLTRRASSVRRALRIGVVLLPSAILLAHAAHYLPFFSDDGFISLRYAERFLAGRGLTWTDGERVEGYSNLLWVLGCALTSVFGPDLVTAARVLGMISSAGIFAAFVYAYRPYRFALAEPSLFASLMLALSPPFAIWAIGGLEQPLLAALLAWGLVLTYRELEADSTGLFGRRAGIAAGMCFGFMCWTRPDAPLLVAAVALGVAAADSVRLAAVKRAARGVLIPVGFWLTQMAFRRLYYRQWVSNSTLAKVAFNRHRLQDGIDYLTKAYRPIEPLVYVLAALVILTMSDRERRRRLIVLLFPLVLWSAYVVVIGGDIFPAHRQFIPSFLILALVFAECAAFCRARAQRWAPLVGWAWAVVLLVAMIRQQTDPDCEIARQERWEWDAVPVGQLLSRGFGDKDPLLAVDAAGALPYFSRLPAVDMLGINDTYLTHHKPSSFGNGLVGQELGDGTYLWSRKPDLIVFHLPIGDERPSFRGGVEMRQRPDFEQFYQLVMLETDSPERVRCHVWIRKEEGVLGIQRSASTIVIPGYLLSSDTFTVGRADESGEIGMVTYSDHPATLRDIPIGVGYWQATIAGEGGFAPVISLSDGKEVHGSERPTFYVAQQNAKLSMAVAPAGALAHVHSISLVRDGDDAK